MRVVQWNISVRSRVGFVAKFIRGMIAPSGTTVVCLQEVLKGAYASLVEELEPTSSALSLELRPPGPHEGRNRHMGVAVLVFGGEVISRELLDRTVFPERTLEVRIGTGLGPVKVLSFHSLTGVGYRKAKAANFAAIADHLAAHPDLDVLCFDANEPRADALDPADQKFWESNGDGGRAAALIMGPQKVHGLEDAYRISVAEHVVGSRPALPITHRTGRVGRRYDHVYCASRWEVISVSHPLEASLAATSDHSAVVVDLVQGRARTQ